jgi:Ca-activated chloride channel family protein
MLEARASEPAGATRAPLALALVIDRSGSMEGSRIAQAIRAARGMIDQLRDGDRVSLVTFDDIARVVVPATELSAESRASVQSAIDGIGLGNATCISCGIDAAMNELDKDSERVRQMILLSDGKANMGVQKEVGFVELAERARGRGVAISTVGVGLAYDERYLAAVAASSNGQHHFVEREAGLPALLTATAETFTSTVASDARVEIALGDGVELVEVMDRSFERQAGRVVVALGALSRGETKTVLMKVRLPSTEATAVALANVALSYRDHLRERLERTAGKLAVAVAEPGTTAAPLDPFVRERVERSRTGALLEEANELLRKGEAAEARRKLARRATELDALATELPAEAGDDSRLGDIQRQLQEQQRVTKRATRDLEPAAGAAAPRPATVAPSLKQNQVDAFRSGL